VTDPYRPFPAAGTPAPSFPRPRLLRAGLDEDTVARLESEYAALDGQQRVEFGRFVSAHSDDAIRDRFSTGVEGVEEPEAPDPVTAPTYEELNALTVDALEDRVRQWNAAHPDQHLTVSGRKGELIGRLLDAHEHLAQQPEPTVQVSEPVQVATSGTEQPTGGTVAAEQQLPTAPTATTPEGAPAAPVAPAGTVETGDASTGAQEPAQTAAAEPGAGTATSTEE
jgi:hypothetical protein